MNTDLIVSFSNLHSAFVNLPPAWANALWEKLKVLKPGDVVLQLSWKSPTDVYKAYVGWAGAATAKVSDVPTERAPIQYLEIDAQYGRALGLRDGQKVSVEFCKDIPVGTSVHVEPLTADDWEILELHAGHIEEQFLNQVRVVWKGQTLTVWVKGQTLIRLKVVETDPEAKCIKLETDAEVIVSPKQRWQPLSTKDDAIPLQNAKRPSINPTIGLRLLPIQAFDPPGNAHDEFGHVVYVGRQVDETLDGQVVYVEKRKLGNGIRKEEAEAGESTDGAEKMLSGVFVFLRRVDGIPSGHVWANEAVWMSLNLQAFARLRLSRPIAGGVTKLEVHVHPANKVDRSESREGLHVDQLFREMVAKSVEVTGHVVLTHGSVTNLPVTDANKTTVPITIRFPSDVLPGQAPEKRDNRYMAITPASIAALQVKEGAPVALEGRQSRIQAEQAPSLAGVDSLIDGVTSHIRNRLGRMKLRSAMRSPGLGGILLYGSRGSGKTSIAKTVMHRLSLEYETLAYSLIIDCTALISERVAKVKESLNETMLRAACHSPAVVVFDDLDRLLPVEQEHTDPTRTRQLSELFIDIITRLCSRYNIAIVATAQQQNAIHSSLTTCHVFGETIHVTSPNKLQRQAILDSLVRETAHGSQAQLDLLSVAGATEGYSPADLKVLVERTLHEAAIRHLGINPPSEEMVMILQEDFKKAQEGYIPASLRGVKLEKGEGARWDDIGGLNATKRTLLETLEWPTKYAPIFANCSLRLRSGLLLYGFPGCGKTLLASAVAKECGLNFISVKGPELLNKYIGASEQSVRELFERASAARPCVLFFDEFDAIAPRRGHDNTGVTDRVVNQMLTQMDGAEGLEGVYVLAATSRPDIIDPALLRPGRLDKSLFCGMPDVEDRLQILQAVASKLSLSPAIDLNSFAEKTEGFSGADLQALVYNAHLEAIHEVLDDVMEREKGEDEVEGDVGEFVVVESEGKLITGVERGAVAKRLETIHKHLQITDLDAREEAEMSDVEEGHKKTVIQPIHLTRALQDTRPSVSNQEKARLQTIYDEFLGGKTTVAVGQRATLA